MVRKIFITLIILLAAVPMAAAETTPDDILNAIDQMTPQQAHDVQTKLAKRQWDPVPGGFFDRLAIKASAGVLHTDDIDLSSLNLSSGNELELENAAGSEVSVMWQLFNERFRAGFKVGSLMAEDSGLFADGYTRVELQNDTSALVANYQLVRTDKFLWWGEAALGGGYITLDIVDTPSDSTTTLTRLEKEYALAELTTGVDWRFNSELSLNAYIGYQFAEEVTLKQDWQDSDVTIDPKGVKGGVGISYNF